MEPGTPWLPVYTVFGSGNWANSKLVGTWDGPGEISPAPRDRPWRNGGTLGDADPFNNGFCGSAQEWAGEIAYPWPIQATNPQGTPLCCFGAKVITNRVILRALAGLVPLVQPTPSSPRPLSVRAALASSLLSPASIQAAASLRVGPSSGGDPYAPSLEATGAFRVEPDSPAASSPGVSASIVATAGAMNFVSATCSGSGLPSTVVCRISAPGCPGYDGVVVSLTYSPFPNSWSGLFPDPNSGLTQANPFLFCSGSPDWTFAMQGVPTGGFYVLPIGETSGAGGPFPSLVFATLISGGIYTGSPITFTITFS